MKLSKSINRNVPTALILMPGIAYASGTKNDYIVLGWIVSIFTFIFFLIFWWLFVKIRGLNTASFSIFIVSALCILPLGFSYIQDGAILPNWYMFIEGKSIGLGGYITNALILLVNIVIFLNTRDEKSNVSN